ncbi:MAG TPA: CocE/NonD family hydrolase [Povalibacter sp.]|nr:CocE/NonD family hydrolase [Povalibacter sp.]
MHPLGSRKRTPRLTQALLCSALIGAGLVGVRAPVMADVPPKAEAVSTFPHWDASKLSTPRYQAKVENAVRVPMRDGVGLTADVYRPEAEGKFPTILVRTPYNMRSPDDIANAKRYATYGYAVVMMDVRGRYLSKEAPYYAYRHEADDGYDTDEWIVKQPWSNGKLGTLGGSYLGYTQVSQATRGNPHLVSMAADVTSTAIHQGWTYVDGAFHLGFALPWGAGVVYGNSGQNVGAVKYDHLPVIEADATMGHAVEHYRDWLEHPLQNDPYWKNISFEQQAHKIKAPLLVVAGWFDIFLRGAIDDQVNIVKAGNRHKRLIIGPWTHNKYLGKRDGGGSVDFGPEANVDTSKIYQAWHDKWLLGIDNGMDRAAPVSIFVMGENRWRNENEWPLARTRYTKYYIHGGGKANSAAGDGVLSTLPPKNEPTDQYVYDPADPVQTLGGNVCCSSVPSGTHDHREIEKRDDVLTYTTPVLTQAVEVTGPIKAKLYAATSAKDTDWVVRLIDVHPDGMAQNIQDGILRARYRAGNDKPASLLDAGKVYEYDVDMWASSNVFLPGHRIRVEITSSNFPRFDRNLNTGEDPATGVRMQKASQTIYHDAKHPSHVLLPIIPRK